ncbi:hypothetical protein [Polyangium spumosum]|uniref:Uncharacterized protein n=1 Tax=Polyangium spumosum TaxID=889282 RepID=A0A6N7PW30_9BACT|nr:hypothetical protein [Polyangium spumosum]MRG96193.1 hypothetical protein [Polyangium spumosum]
MARRSRAVRRGASRPLKAVHVVGILLLLVGSVSFVFVLGRLREWLEERDTLVDVNASPRLARAAAALRALDACSVEYDHKGLFSKPGMRLLDVFLVKPCGASRPKHYSVPEDWNTNGKQVPFMLKRDSRNEPWRVHGSARPDELARALEAASPALLR